MGRCESLGRRLGHDQRLRRGIRTGCSVEQHAQVVHPDGEVVRQALDAQPVRRRPDACPAAGLVRGGVLHSGDRQVQARIVDEEAGRVRYVDGGRGRRHWPGICFDVCRAGSGRYFD